MGPPMFATTKMAGPPEIMQFEDKLLNGLVRAGRASIQNQNLVLGGPSVNLKFAPSR